MSKLNLDNKVLLRVPRNMQIFIAQYIAAGFLLYGLIILIPLIIVASRQQHIDSGLTLLSLITALPLIIGFGSYYILQQYVKRVGLNKERNVLQVIKKTDIEEINIYGAVSIISKTLKQRIGGVKYSLSIKFNEDELELFKECAATGYRWELFSDNLASLIGLPTLKEYWIENYNGKLIQRSRKEHITSYKRSLLIIIPAALSLLAAVDYAISPTRISFISFGLISALINVFLSLLFIIKNKLFFADWTKNKYLLIVYVIISLVQNGIFYIAYTFLFNGLKLPGIL